MTFSTQAPPAQAVREAYGQATRRLADAAEIAPYRVGDGELVALLDVVERAGRLVDATRARFAAELAQRFARQSAPDDVCSAHGCRTPVELMTRATGIASREAHRRIRLGKNLAGSVPGALDGYWNHPPAYPAVAVAMVRGELGVDSAEQIVAALDPTFSCCDAQAIGVAERSLVASATGMITAETAGQPHAGVRFAADHIRTQGALWQARLDPDGAAPDDTAQGRRSSVGFGRLRDGLYPLRGAVTPDLRGVMDALFNSYLSARSRPAFPETRRDGVCTAEHPSTADPSAAEHARAEDLRTTDEKRADILHGLLDWAARQPGAPTMSGSAPTVLVHVNVRDLESGIGVGWIDGLDGPVPLRTVRQSMCTDGFDTAIFDRDGAILRFGTTKRTFSRAQRRVMAARDGGCVIPGCGAPVQWTEAHHVVPWADGGRTDVDNGVLLCWFHHHEIGRSGWHIRMVGGRPEVQSPHWLDLDDTWRSGGQNRASRPTPSRWRPGGPASTLGVCRRTGSP